ncbi:MAG TPA: hypothetical protein VII92_15315, partial [Anaerolineae bacterium]
VLAVVVLFGLSLIAPLPQLVAGFGFKYGEESPGIIQDWYSIHLSDLIALPPRLLLNERATLGVLLPVLIVISFVIRRRVPDRFFWLLAGAVFLILSLGPTFEVFNLPLPFRLFQLISRDTYRVAARFLLPAAFALIVFAILSLRPLYERLVRSIRSIVVGGVIVLLALEGRWYEPLPVFSMPDYNIYHTIGNDPAEYTILEVPVGPENLFHGIFGHGGVLQYYAPIHHKRLINGAVSRAPLGLTQSYRQWPMITALADEGPVPDRASARAEFERLSGEWDIRYVLIHRDLASSEAATWASGFFNTQSGWCLVDEEGPILAYSRVANGNCVTADHLDPPQGGKIDPGSSDSERYLGLGWYYAENIGGPQARWTGREAATELRVHLAQQKYRVTLAATSFAPGQVIAVNVNGQHVTDLTIGQGWTDYTFDVPANVIAAEGVTSLTFVHSRADSPFMLTNGQS